jgi:hypothetical protein
MTAIVASIVLGLFEAAPLVLAASAEYYRLSVKSGGAHGLLREGGR